MDIRVSTIPSAFGERIVLRLLDQSAGHLSLDQLMMPKAVQEKLSRALLKPHGIILVTGPTGSGKTTTLYSGLSHINSRSRNILTIEDPVEYLLPGIGQTQVNAKVDMTFARGLRAILRQDPDVVMVGEIRDGETAEIAIQASLTGHLVLSTLHTNTAGQTVDRIIDSFPGDQQDQVRMQLAASLLGVFSQRLIPGINGGRVPAYELLINNTAVANLIREKRTHEIDMVIETGFELGMVDMNRCLVDLVKQGLITVENAYAYSTNPKNLERLL